MRYCLALALLAAAPAAAQLTPGSCTATGTASADLDANNVRARLYNTGGLFWKGAGSVYNVPVAAEGQLLTPNAVFASGIWVGGVVGTDTLLAATDYGPWEFYPGPLAADGTPDDADCSNPRYDRIYVVDRQDVSAYEAGVVPIDDLRDWPTGLGAPTLAPAADDGLDNDGDGLTDEAGEMAPIDLMGQPLADRKGRTIDLAAGERPDLSDAAQLAWWVMNDVAGPHGTTGSAPIGLEVHASAYVVAGAGALGNTTFYRYRLFKRGAGDLTDTYFGYWTDPDLGNASDDYVGSDTTLGMGFVYNGDDFDEGSDGYGQAPPALGNSFLEGPTHSVPALPVWLYWNSATSPNGNPRPNSLDWYRYLTGRWLDNKPMVTCGNGYPGDTSGLACDGDGDTTTVMWPGDPVTEAFWSERNYDGAGAANTPSDRSYVQSTGPFALASGDETSVTLALVWSRGDSNLGSIIQLREDMAHVQQQFAEGFASPPAYTLPSGTPTIVTPVASSVTTQVVQTSAAGAHENDRDVQALLHFTRGESAEDSLLVRAGARVELDPGTYEVRSRYTAGPLRGPWTEPITFTVSDAFVPMPKQASFQDFRVTANASGVLATPAGAAADFRSFPGLGRTNAALQQATDAGGMSGASGKHQTFWFIATSDAYVDFASADGNLNFADFAAATTQHAGGLGSAGRTGVAFVGARDYEVRFTGNGKAWVFSDGPSAQSVIDVPFELWAVGVTPDDPSDDFQLVPYLFDDDASGDFSLRPTDSALSSASNDPITDRIYWMQPANETPGSQGYENMIAALEASGDGSGCAEWYYAAGEASNSACDAVALMHRMAFVSWNGSIGDAADGNFYDPVLPEIGTVFYLDFSPGEDPQPAVLLSPASGTTLDSTPYLLWTGPGDAELSRDADFASSVDAMRTPGGGGTSESVSVDRLEAGTYWWRVRSQALDGSPVVSEARSFTLTRTITSTGTDEAPRSLTLLSPAPHPISGPARLRFFLPQPADAQMEAYDLLGRRVAVLFEGARPAGWSEAAWPSELSAGVYLVRLRAGGETQTRQVVVVR